MPPKQPAACCGETAVVVSVYVEKPRRRVFPSNPNRRHGHHHPHHPHVRQRIIHQRIGSGYDRRAHLLLYSQQLRESVRRHSDNSKPFLRSRSGHSIHQPTTKIIAFKEKSKTSTTPDWLSSWKTVLVPNFLKSWLRKKEGNTKSRKRKQYKGLTMNKMSSIMKNLDAKKVGFVAKLFSSLRRRR